MKGRRIPGLVAVVAACLIGPQLVSAQAVVDYGGTGAGISLPVPQLPPALPGMTPPPAEPAPETVPPVVGSELASEAPPTEASAAEEAAVEDAAAGDGEESAPAEELFEGEG